MEVASYFTNRKEDIEQLESFFNNHPNLECTKKDADTAYFKNKKTNVNEFYYHYMLDDIKEEFTYNYSEEEISFIRNYFMDREYYLIDITYRNSDFLIEILKDYSEKSFDTTGHKSIAHIDDKFIELH